MEERKAVSLLGEEDLTSAVGGSDDCKNTRDAISYISRAKQKGQKKETVRTMLQSLGFEDAVIEAALRLWDAL